MTYTVTFFALCAGAGEVEVTVHRVEPLAITAYTATPEIALAAARTVRGDPRADGFRVRNPEGRVILDYVGRA